MAWSFSKLQHFDPGLARALAEQAIAQASSLTCTDVPQLAWALCKQFEAEAAAIGIGELPSQSLMSSFGSCVCSCTPHMFVSFSPQEHFFWHAHQHTRMYLLCKYQGYRKWLPEGT